MSSSTLFKVSLNSKLASTTATERIPRNLVVKCQTNDQVKSHMSKLKQAGIALVSSSILLASNPQIVSAAPEIGLGRQVFNGNCAACHAGGNNTIISDRTLRAEAIKQYLDGGFNIAAIKYQVQNGKGAMPAWSGTLSEDEIDSVVAYVFKQANDDSWDNE